jgi:hypothetical protein
MKLTKAKLTRELRDELIKFGYKEFKDSITGANGLFIKIVRPGFFLTLGLNISRLYEERFTAELYLSKSTIWGAVWGDLPNDSYVRVGTFLTREERKLYLDDAYQTIDGDAWWQNNRKGDIQKFLEALKITEGRLLNQIDLLKKIDNSIELRELIGQVNDVFDIVYTGAFDNRSYKFIPEKEIDGIPMKWFKAAELVLMNEGRILNRNTVKRLAADSWRQRELGRMLKPRNY